MDIIVYGGIGAVVIMLLAWWCGRKTRPDYVTVGDAILLPSANRLEELLINAADAKWLPELTVELKRSTLVVPCCADGTIASMTLRFPPEFEDGSGDYVLKEDGQIERGPLVFCYSSQTLVEQIRKNDDVGHLVITGGGALEMRERPAKEVFAFALREDLTVRLNPFGGVAHTFTREELLELTKAD